METLRQDIRYAVRRLARSRGFTLLAVVTLALGIGANSAIFSVVNAVLLRPLSFPEPHRLDQVHSTRQGSGHIPVSAPDFRQMERETRAYEALAAYTLTFPNLTREGEPVRLNGTSVSASFLSILGSRPVLGRAFREDENEPGNTRVVLLGHGLWQQRFGGDPTVLGRSIQLDGEPYEVVGVMPAGFDFPEERELWTPIAYGPIFSDDNARSGHFLSVIGRRRAGVSAEEAAADIAAIAGRIEQAFPALKTGFGGTAVPLSEELVGDIRLPLLVLLGAVGLVLLIACANVANLLLARAAAREGELALRTALGAGRGRLLRQLLTESVLLGLLGGVLGLLLGTWGTAWLLDLQPQGIPRLEEVRLDRSVAAFTLGVSLLTGLLFGLYPAWQVTRGELVDGIREGGRGSLTGRRSARMRGTLVVAETALAVMLLVGAGLLIRSFAHLSAVDLGFRQESALVFDLALPAAAYPDNAQTLAFYTALEERLRAIPGVVAAGASSAPPLSGFYSGGPMVIEGGEPARPGEEDIVQIRVVTPELLPTLGVQVLRGRGVLATDGPDAPPVVLLTESAEARFFGGGEALGSRVAMGGPSDPAWAEVVGIVGDVRGDRVAEEGEPGIYFAHAQRPARQMSLVVRTVGEPMRLVGAVREEVQALDRNLPIFNARTLEQVVGESVSQPRFYTLLLAVFAAAALLLSAVGIFGVMSSLVAQRTREIGIRIALGAAPRLVLRSVVGGAMTLTLAGVAIGVVGSVVGARLLAALLFGVSPGDPATFLAVALILTGVAAGASYLPARRAVRVDPMVALRGE
jgi:putative ABC transport system permease protein